MTQEVKQEMQPEVNDKMNPSTKWAIGGTVVWLAGVAAYISFKWCKFLAMEPNAFGDFLAGTFSPLALCWLVAGYWQQGKELKQNRKALWFQQRELAEQVKATLDLGAHAEQQAKASLLMVDLTRQERVLGELNILMSTQPKFKITNVPAESSWDQSYSVTNEGGVAHNIQLNSGDFYESTHNLLSPFEESNTGTFSLGRPRTTKTLSDFKIGFEYTDYNGVRRLQTFHVQAKKVSPPTLTIVL